ncbi:hypothetical protein EJB05_00140, partial [Eragrostis curvula]
MEDGTGQIICGNDHVMLNNTTTGAHGERGRALKSLSGHRIVVQRVDGAVTTEHARDVTVADRSFFHPGMAVASASDRGGQVGIVTGVATALDLLVDDGESAVARRGVSPAEVRRVSRELCLGDYVVSGPWLGRVFELSLDVDVLFDDGAAVCRCRVAEAAGSNKLSAVNKDCLNPHTNCCFYPGQRVVVAGSGDDGCSDVFKASRWLKGYWKPSYVQGTVSKVATAGVLVNWVASSDSRQEQHHLVRPSAHQLPDNLTFFSPGDEQCFWSVGDRCFFRDTPSSSTAASVPARGLRGRMRRRRRVDGRRRAEFARPMCVADTRTTVDVVWQDGTRQRGVPSVSLVQSPAQHWHDFFFPGHRVFRRSGGDGNNAAGRVVGVVRSVNHNDQTVRVSWLNKQGSGESADMDGNDETLSAFDLGRMSSDHDVFYGDIVLRRHPTDSAGGESGEEPSPTQKTASTGDASWWVGHIIDFCGDAHRVRVKWGDGRTSNVLRHEIAVVRQPGVDHMLQEIGGWVHDDGDASNAAEIAQEDDTNINVESSDDSGSESDGEDGSAPARPATGGRVGDVVQAVVRLTGSVIAQGRRYLLPSGQEVSAGEATADATGSNESFHFPQFDVVQSPSDHHYLDDKEQGTGGGRKWTKRVQKEWKILKNDLPGGIYVRVFEDRMDLLRVAMVGANGTPYQEGLFFFDIQLPPSSYPDSPPLVNYRSFGLRPNPNLYESGTVCLSLLNTFGGHGTELWSPEASTVLQVIVSIQGLVLNAQPYYNEAGYESQVGTPQGRHNELLYSEKAYVLSLQTMLHLLRRPPAGFEDLVKEHFRRRGRHVLRACEAYLQEGCLVGTPDGTTGSKERPCSSGFRFALANVVPRLFEAFSIISAEGCEKFNRLGMPPP